MEESFNEEEIDIVLRHTTLSRDEVIEKLKKNNNKYLSVIEEFMGINKNKKNNREITVNQQIYKEIRTVMDTASNNFKTINLH